MTTPFCRSVVLFNHWKILFFFLITGLRGSINAIQIQGNMYLQTDNVAKNNFSHVMYPFELSCGGGSLVSDKIGNS